MATNKNTPPSDLNAEQSVLGSMMIEADAIDKAASALIAGDFYRDGHGTIFNAVLRMREQRTPVDFVTIQAELNDRNALEAIGGAPYLAALLDKVPTAANVGYYAEIVSEKSQQRQAWEIFQRLAQAVSGPVKDTAALIQQAKVELDGITTRKATNSPRQKPIAERLIDLADVQPPGDAPLMFGKYLLEGHIHWIAGASGIGKSTFLYNVLCSLAEGNALWGIECKQQKILYVDMESGDWGRSKKVERLYQDTDRVRGQLLFAREPIRLPDEQAELLAAVQEMGVTLVVFDTARRCFVVKDENDNGEFYAKIAPTLDALKQRGAASITLGHVAKNPNGEVNPRGAGSQVDAVDVAMTLTMNGGMDKNDPNGVVKVAVTKHRLFGMEVPPLLLKRVGDDQFERMEASEIPNDTPERERTKGERCEGAILAYLADADGPTRHTELMEAMLTMQHKQATFGRALKDLKEKGGITQDAATRCYSLPDDGDPQEDAPPDDPFSDI